MSRFLNAMSKLGLVELEEGSPSSASPADADDIERILKETRELMDTQDGAPQEAEEPPEAPPVVIDEHTPTTLEELSFLQIYEAAAVPPAPYEAEKLLKVLEGLRAMDTAMRKAAVMAMDAADEDWTLDDSLLDAQRKVDVLRAERQKVESVALAAEQKANGDLSAQDEYKTQAAQTIREQISELEALLEQELQKVAEEKADIMRQLEQTKTGCQNAIARYDAEIERLSSLAHTFGHSTGT